MELEFKHERITAIRRLRGLTAQEICDRMTEAAGGHKTMNIDRWEHGIVSPNSLVKVKLLAEATSVPIGFYYYNAVDITLENNIVNIYIHETKETTTFKFINP